MKLKKIIPLFDPLNKIEIWTSDQEEDAEEPFYSGCIFDMPWIFLNMTIGRLDGTDEPIYFYTDESNNPVMVVNLIEEEYTK